MVLELQKISNCHATWALLRSDVLKAFKLGKKIDALDFFHNAVLFALRPERDK